MIRQPALKVVLVIVGLLFVAIAYAIVELRENEALQMRFGIYVTLGVALLVGSRNPSANGRLRLHGMVEGCAGRGYSGTGMA